MLYQFTSRIKELAELGHTSHFCFIAVEKGYIVPPNHTNFHFGKKSPLVIVGSKGSTWAALNQSKQVYFSPFENISGSFCSFCSNFMLRFWSHEKINTFQMAWRTQTRVFPWRCAKMGIWMSTQCKWGCSVSLRLVYDLEPELIWFVTSLSAGYRPSFFGVNVDKLC